MKKIITILFLFASAQLSAQYFDITKVLFDNISFENSQLQNFYKQNITIESKQTGVIKIISEIEKENAVARISNKDNCYYNVLVTLDFLYKNDYTEATKRSVKAKQIAEDLNEDQPNNVCSILASLIYRNMNVNTLVVDELSKCNNLKEHEQYQVLISKIVYAEMTKEFDTVKATIQQLGPIAKRTSNYDHLYFSKTCFYFYLENLNDYNIALKYSFLRDSILDNFLTGKRSCPDLFYADLPTFDEDYILFEKIFLLSNQATVYRLLNNLAESESCLNKAIALSKKYKGAKHLSFLYNNFGLTFTILKKYDKANDYYQSSLTEYISQKKAASIAETYNLLAKNELLRNQQQSVAEYCQKAIKTAEPELDYKNLAASYFILSELYQLNSDYLNAQKKYLQFSYYADLSEKTKAETAKKEAKENAEALVSIFNIGRDFSAAEKKELELIRVNLQSEQRAQELLLLKKENELKEKTLQNQQLEKDRALKSLALIQEQLEKERLALMYNQTSKDAEIKKLELEKNKVKINLLYSKNAIYEKEEVLKNLEIKNNQEQKKYLTIGLISLTIGLIVFAIFFSRNIKQRKIIQKNNSELEKITTYLKNTNSQLEDSVIEINKQKEIIEHANHQIVESINYSLRIQEAFLSKQKDLNTLFNDYFIFSKAKDIVNGDFFLITKKRNKIYVAVADCTGHGVPGALLTIIGYNEISHLIEYYDLSPAKILEKLNTKFNQLLNTKGQIGSDGMDIMLVEIDTSTRTLTFAGARSYLLVFNDNHLSEYSGNRMSIGEFTEDEINFKNHQLPISENSKIYLYTDGFQDQQIEKTKKRIGSKLFKQSILQEVHAPFAHQKKSLIDLYETQKGILKQTDDITVLAFSPNLNVSDNESSSENPKIKELFNTFSHENAPINNLVVSYGKMNHALIVSLIHLLEIKLTSNNFKKQFINRIRITCIELLQNITKHQYPDNNYAPYFIVKETNNAIIICSGNVITNEKYSFLNEKLKTYTEEDASFLKNLYVQTLTEGTLSAEGNAGLGLLTIAIKSEQKMKYDFIKINNQYYHFNLQLVFDKSGHQH